MQNRKEFRQKWNDGRQRVARGGKYYLLKGNINNFRIRKQYKPLLSTKKIRCQHQHIDVPERYN
jgi:hypothetical protein